MGHIHAKETNKDSLSLAPPPVAGTRVAGYGPYPVSSLARQSCQLADPAAGAA